MQYSWWKAAENVFKEYYRILKIRLDFRAILTFFYLDIVLYDTVSENFKKISKKIDYLQICTGSILRQTTLKSILLCSTRYRSREGIIINIDEENFLHKFNKFSFIDHGNVLLNIWFPRLKSWNICCPTKLHNCGLLVGRNI